MKPEDTLARLRLEISFLREEKKPLSLPAMRAMADRLNWLEDEFAYALGLQQGLQNVNVADMDLKAFNKALKEQRWTLRKLSAGLAKLKPVRIYVSHTYLSRVLKDPALMTAEYRRGLIQLTGIKF